MRYGDLTYEEIRDRAREGWLAIVPTGCTEQQGPHLPVDFDSWFVEQLCLAAAGRAAQDFEVHSVVLPTMPFGPTPEHRNYGSGYVDIPQELHESVVSAVLKSLVEQGFRRIVVWRGCGGHDLRSTVARFNTEYRRRARAYLPGHPYHDIWCRVGDPAIPGGHADSFTTSIALHLRPESVRVDRVVYPDGVEINWDEPDLDFSRYSSTGVIGDPTHASAELGARLWEVVVQEVALTLEAIAEGKKGSRLVSRDGLHFLRRLPHAKDKD